MPHVPDGTPWQMTSIADLLDDVDLGEPDAVEAAITFLERDAWFPGSGYLKEHVLRRLYRQTFDAGQANRLTSVVLHAVDAGDRLEFRWYCRLARRIAVAPVREGLMIRLHDADPKVRRRALWMLADLRRPQLRAEELAAVRRAVLDLAADRPPHDWSPSLRNLAVRFWSLAWEAELLRLAASGTERARGAIRLLARLPRLHLPCEPLVAERIKRERAGERSAGP